MKYTPITLACIETVYTILAYYNIDCTILNYIGGSSFISLLILYISSYVFKFCYLYRLPIYYIVIINLISIYDYHFGIPLNDSNMLRLYIIITGIFIITYIYKKVKHAKTNKSLIAKRN